MAGVEKESMIVIEYWENFFYTSHKRCGRKEIMQHVDYSVMMNQLNGQ